MGLAGSTIYNKDSRFLSEVPDRTVDLVITSPPFNICHRYKTYHDSLDYEDFDSLYTSVINSISRVLKDTGVFLVDIADIIVMENNIIYGAEFIKEKAEVAGLHFICSFPYIAIEGSDKKMNSCIPRSDKDKKFHSSCEQILVFCKNDSCSNLEKQFHIKPKYIYSDLHDSAFWPQELIKDIIAPFDLNGLILLDPFMGSGSIGRIAIERGGRFIGYDIDKDTLYSYGWL